MVNGNMGTNPLHVVFWVIMMNKFNKHTRGQVGVSLELPPPPATGDPVRIAPKGRHQAPVETAFWCEVEKGQI